MKKIKYLLVGIVCAALLIPLYIHVTERTIAAQQEPLTKAMAAAGAEAKEVSINGWAQLDNKTVTEDDIEKLVKQAMNELGIAQNEYKITVAKDKYHHMVRADAVKDYCHAVAICQVLYVNQKVDNKEFYMVINIDTGPNFAKTDFHKKIMNFFHALKCTPRITTCLVGWFDGKLNEDEWLRKLNAAFASIDAKESDRLVNSQFASLAGYTQQIKDYVTVGEKTINIQMVMRYSRHDNRTYLIIGSPVITREY